MNRDMGAAQIIQSGGKRQGKVSTRLCKFRLYWSFLLPGILLIRRVLLKQLKNAAGKQQVTVSGLQTNLQSAEPTP
jgi:hypothetical protein